MKLLMESPECMRRTTDETLDAMNKYLWRLVEKLNVALEDTEGRLIAAENALKKLEAESATGRSNEAKVLRTYSSGTVESYDAIDREWKQLAMDADLAALEERVAALEGNNGGGE